MDVSKRIGRRHKMPVIELAGNKFGCALYRNGLDNRFERKKFGTNGIDRLATNPLKTAESVPYPAVM